jgi:transcriptional regulator with XRE-family HTH domain
MTKEKIAQVLRRRRRSLDITQAEVAKRAKLSQSTVAQIERGRKLPSCETLLAILPVLQLDIVFVLAEV